MASTRVVTRGDIDIAPWLNEASRASRSSTQVVEPVWVDLAVGLALASGLLLRFWSSSALWLDEALTVNIARLPLDQIPEALRHDGAPPLHYVLLHGWMRLFGDSNLAVRGLSGVLSLATIPLVFVAGRRVGGREGGWIALIVSVTSPFAIRYATEARMYSLVILLAAAGFLALDAFLSKPTTPRLAGLMACSALLVLTHYWAVFLIGAVALALAIHADRAPRRMPASWAIVGLATGSLAFLPWLPSFLYQLEHTGTPWTTPPRLSSIIFTLFSFGGLEGDVGQLLGPVLVGIAALGSIGTRFDHQRMLLDLRGSSPGRGLAMVVVVALLAAIVTGLATGSGFAPRYASTLLVPFLLLVTLGVQALADVRWRHGVLVAIAALGLVGGAAASAQPRTQAHEIAGVLNAKARPSDVVVYCPDQLGPAVDRLLTVRARQVTYPRLRAPQRVDWVDYAERIGRTDTAAFAARVHALAGRRPVWLVWSYGYRSLGNRCEELDLHLANVRPGRTPFVRLKPSVGAEHAHLTRYSVPPWPPQRGPTRR